jgi:tRNA(Ile)-lysidine synthase
MALALLLDEWCREKGVRLMAMTVDHALRPEAAEEATLVGRWLNSKGIEHCILTRTGDKPKAAIQAFAREARYALMTKRCHDLRIRHLFVGHQQEDQLETFVQRFAMGSSVAGLSAMSLLAERDNIYIVRPLLGDTRKELRDFLVDLEQDWIEDPSNEDPRFTRTDLGRIVRDISSLPESSFSTLQKSIDRVKDADDALSHYVEKAWQKNVDVSPLGFERIDCQLFRGEPKEIALRVLSKAIKDVSGGQGYSRLKDIERLYSKLVAGTLDDAVTLMGCKIQIKSDQLLICREPGRDGLEILAIPDGGEVWDNRFIVKCGEDLRDQFGRQNAEIRILGDEGWRIIKESPIPKEVAELPAIIRKNLPSLWLDGKLVAAPLVLAETLGLGIAKGAVRMVFIPYVGSERSS